MPQTQTAVLPPVPDLEKALSAGLEELAITREHIDWMRDLLEGRYPEDVTDQLCEHLQEEEHAHELSLRALRNALAETGLADDALTLQLDQEIFRLHLMQDHFDTVRDLNHRHVSSDLAAKMTHHILEEEERHLRGVTSLKQSLVQVKPPLLGNEISKSIRGKEIPQDARHGEFQGLLPSQSQDEAPTATDTSSRETSSASATPVDAGTVVGPSQGGATRETRSTVGSLLGVPMPGATLEPATTTQLQESGLTVGDLHWQRVYGQD